MALEGNDCNASLNGGKSNVLQRGSSLRDDKKMMAYLYMTHTHTYIHIYYIYIYKVRFYQVERLVEPFFWTNAYWLIDR